MSDKRAGRAPALFDDTAFVEDLTVPAIPAAKSPLPPGTSTSRTECLSSIFLPVTRRDPTEQRSPTA